MNKKISKGAVLLMVALTAACAKPPSSIAPVSISTSNYQNYSCSQLSNEINLNARELAASEQRQRNAVAGDAVGVFLVLIPPSAFTGDASADVAMDKGEDIAMRRAFANRCI